MKKSILIGLLSLSSLAGADTTGPLSVTVTGTSQDGSTVPKIIVYPNGMDSNGDNRRMQVDTSGRLLVSSSSAAGGAGQFVSFTAASASLSGVAEIQTKLDLASTAAAQATQLTALNSSLAALTTTVLPAWVDLTQTSYTLITTNATVTIGVTITAASSAYKSYWVLLAAETGMVSLRYATANSVTAPTFFSASAGAQVFPNDNPKTVGIFANNTGDSPHLFLRASALSGATSGTALFIIRGMR